MKPRLKWVGWVYRAVRYRRGDTYDYSHLPKRHFRWLT